MAKYGVFESVNMKSTHYGEHMFDAVVTAETQNGSVGYVEDGTLKTFTTATIGKFAPVIVDQVPWSYDTSSKKNQARSAFVNAKNTMVRTRAMGMGDRFALTAEAISGTPAVGKYLVLANNSAKLTVADAATGAFVAKITGTHKSGECLSTDGYVYGISDVMYDIEVLANTVSLA